MERTSEFLVKELKCVSQAESADRIFFVSALEVKNSFFAVYLEKAWNWNMHCIEIYSRSLSIVSIFYSSKDFSIQQQNYFTIDKKAYKVIVPGQICLLMFILFHFFNFTFSQTLRHRMSMKRSKMPQREPSIDENSDFDEAGKWFTFSYFK